eukprot:561391-Pelagomonas_calceolata.AAC.4
MGLAKVHAFKAYPLLGPRVRPHAGKAQRTLLDMSCSFLRRGGGPCRGRCMDDYVELTATAAAPAGAQGGRSRGSRGRGSGSWERAPTQGLRRRGRTRGSASEPNEALDEEDGSGKTTEDTEAYKQ